MKTDFRLLVAAYHYVQPRGLYPYQGIHAIAPERFLQQVELLSRFCHPADPDHLFSCWQDSTFEGDHFYLTFDDGLKEHLELARTLYQKGLKAGFFVTSRPLLEKKALVVQKIHWLRSNIEPVLFTTWFSELLPEEWSAPWNSPDRETAKKALESYRFDTPEVGLMKYLVNFVLPNAVVDHITAIMLERKKIDEASFCRSFYLSEDDIREMLSLGHTVGCHGHLHIPFSRFPNAASLQSDLETNIHYLTNLTGKRPSSVAYPFGSEWALPADPIAFCRNFNFDIGLTTHHGWNNREISLDSLRRVDAIEIERVFAES